VEGDVHVHDEGPTGTSIGLAGGNGTATITVDGNIIVDKTDLGDLNFAVTSGTCQMVQTAGHGITDGSTGYTDGFFKIMGLTQGAGGSITLAAGADAQDFYLDQGTYGPSVGALTLALDDVTMDGAEVNSFAQVEAKHIAVFNNRFAGATALTKTGSIIDTVAGNVFLSDLSLTNAAPSTAWRISLGGNDTVYGDLNATSLYHNLVLAFDSRTVVHGDLTCDNQGAGELRLGNGGTSGRLVMAGSGNQRIRVGADAEVEGRRLTIDKPSGRVLLSDTLQLTNAIYLVDGILECTDGGMVRLLDGAQALTPSDNSYIEGPVQKVGNDAFTFPVGRNGHYSSVGISAPSSVTDVFTAEYFENNSDFVHTHSSKDGSISEISRNEYWNLSRQVGSSTPTVTLSWDTVSSCGIDNITNLKVATWDGSNWDDLGKASSTGTVDVGTLTANLTSSSFEIYALATGTSFACRPGAGCSEAIDMGEGDSCITDLAIKAEQTWFSFNADSANIELIFENMHGFAVDTAIIYEECGGSSVPTFHFFNGTQLLVKAYNLVVGEDYFLMMDGKPSAGSGSDMCKEPYYYQSRDGGLCDVSLPFPSYEPAVEWRNTSWYPIHPATQAPISHAASSEDWWYGHNNSYKDDLLNGYICVGYSKFATTGPDAWVPTEASYDGCYDGGSGIRVTMGLISPNGQEVVWTKAYSDGELYSVLQTDDGGYIAVGRSMSTRKNDGSDLIYNPTSSGTTDHFSESAGHCNLGGVYEDHEFSVRHGYVIRVDASGNVVWEYIYGYPDFSSSGTVAYRAESEFYDIIETTEGNFRVVGGASTTGDVDQYKLLFMVEIDPDGYLQWKKYDHPLSYPTGGYATGIDRFTDGSEVKYVVSGRTYIPGPVGGECMHLYDLSAYGQSSEVSTYAKASVFVYSEGDTEDNEHDWWWSPNVYPFNSNSSTTYDVKVNSNNEILVPVLSRNPNSGPCFEAGYNTADLTVFHVTSPFTVSNQVELGIVTAFDLKAGITLTSDGGYAIVSSKQPDGPLTSLEGTVDDYHYTNTDAYVAKIGPDGDLEWETTFESDPPPSGMTDPKRQECMYHITEAPDGGLVVSGNNSYNGSDPFEEDWGDDNYLAKLYSDCNKRQSFDPYTETLEYFYEIETDETWSSSKKIREYIFIPPGVTLTIQGEGTTIEFNYPTNGNEMTGIQVAQGGKLIVNDATLTALECCDYQWTGIQVWGDRYGTQSTSAGGDQGVVILNNAKIEHAKVGVDLIDLSNVGISGGGVIQATGATFRNCRKAVSFGPYDGAAGNANNISFFTGVTFLCDGPMRSLAYNWVGTNQFVSIWGTGGVVFKNCTWEFDYDNPSFPEQLPVNKWPTGIFSAYAGYDLFSTNGGYSGGNNFNNLQIGVMGYDLFGLNRVRANYNSFSNVYRNFDFTGTYRLDIQHCDHELPMADSEVPSYGIRSDHNVSYGIHANNYYPDDDNTKTIGTLLEGSLETDFITFNSGSAYKNHFDGLDRGTQTKHNNLIVQVNCNWYGNTTGNNKDWALNPGQPGKLAHQGTACPINPSGTDGIRSGNTFENVVGGTSLYAFNLQDQATYFGAGGVNDYTVPDVTGTNIAVEGNSQGCAMTVEDPSCDGLITNPHEYDLKRHAYQKEWYLKIDELDTLMAYVDSMQTQLLLDTIANGSTLDTVMRDLLVYHTPLSDTVLSAYINRTSGVTPASFQTVMLRNVPASKTVWDLLVTEFDTYEDTWTDWIKAADTISSAQKFNPGVITATSLGREIRYHGGWAHQYAGEVAGYWIENDDMDSAKAYMDTVGLYPMRMALLGIELSEGNWDEADSSLAKLPLATTNDTAVYDLFDIMIDLGRDTLTILDMGSTDSTRVRQIAADTTLDAHVLAQGILSILIDTVFLKMPEDIPESPSERRAAPEWDSPTESPTEASYFKAYPNPFNQQVTIAYNLKDDCSDGCFIRLTDIQGRTVYEQPISTGSGPNSITFDLGRYETGMYICSLYNNQRLLQTSRLIRME